MRHHNSNRKFGRETDQRRALMKSLALSLIERGRITTTLAKAKELKSFIEKLVTQARKAELAARREVARKLGVKKVVQKFLDETAPKYKERKGGYTRLIKVANRYGDASPMAIIEFV